MNKRLVILSILLAVFAGYLKVVPFHREVPLRKSFVSFPLLHSGWSGKDQRLDDIILDKLKVSEYMSREYVKGAQRMGLYVGYYNAQREGAQIHSPKHCLPGGGWQNVSERTRTLMVDGAGPVNFVEAVYRKGDQQEVFVYWYKMKNAYITGDYRLKAQMIMNSVMYRRNDAAFVRLSTPANGSAEEGMGTVEAFMRDFVPVLNEYLPE